MDLAFGFPKIAKICYGPGIHSPGSNLELLVNKDLYKKLPSDLKEIIRVAASNANTQSYGEFIYRNALSFQIVTNKHKVEYKILPESIIKEFLKISKQVVIENAEKDPLAMKVHQSYQDFLKKSIDITKFQELGYLNARNLANS
jgi:TRAP-type mannitol/chloroaromatic compound transport system substrate-binding protein